MTINSDSNRPSGSSRLIGSVSDSLQSIVVNCSISKEICSTLESHFNRPSNSLLFEAQHKIQTMSKVDKPMYVYLHEIKALSDQLSFIGSPMTEAMKIFSALCGLERGYKPIKITVEVAIDNVPSPTVEFIIPRLVPFDDRLKSYNTCLKVSPHLAYAAVRTNKSGNATLREDVDEEEVVGEALTPLEEEVSFNRSRLPLMVIHALSVKSYVALVIQH